MIQKLTFEVSKIQMVAEGRKHIRVVLQGQLESGVQEAGKRQSDLSDDALLELAKKDDVTRPVFGQYYVN